MAFDRTKMIDVTELNAAIAKVVEEAGIDVTVAQRKIVLDILTGVVRKTPVDEGPTRANWQVTVGRDTRREAENSDPVATGASAIASLAPFQLVFVVNNKPNVVVLEFGLFDPKNPGPTKDKRRKGKTLVRDGFSTQAPGGMARLTLDEIKRSLTDG
jgi:hypothetical protein